MGNSQRSNAAVLVAPSWTRSRSVLRAIRRYVGGCHRIGDLFQRGAVYSSRHAVVTKFSLAVAIIIACFLSTAGATTKGLSQIVTPDLQEEGDLSLSLQIQDKRIANPYQLQAELGLTKWAEIAVFQGFKPNEEIFATEFGILTKEPYLLSIGFTNWSPRSGVDPQPYIEAGYYTEHNKFIVGAIHAGYKNEAILGYAYDFNKQWRVQVDFQSGTCTL